MMKAPAPIMGGMICPPVEAVASTAAATAGLNPVFTIKGIVMPPSTAVLATALPLIIPNSELEKTEILAGPPRNRPATEYANLTKKSPAPDI